MLRIFIFLTLSSLLLCCNSSRNEHDEGALPPAEVPASYLSVRVNFAASELEDGVNELLPQMLIDGAFPMKDEGDSLFLKIRRKGKLQLQVVDNEVFASIPLRITASAKKKVLGITLSNQDSPITFSATVNASTLISLQGDWQMGFICKWGKFELEEDPKISFMGMRFSVGKTINKIMDDYSDNLSDIICRSLRESISFDEVLNKVYEDLQATHRIAKQPDALYLRSTPVAMSGVLVPNKDTLSIHLEYRTKIHISPEHRIIINKVPLEERADPMNTKSAFVAYPELIIPYPFLNATLENLLVGETYNYEGYEVRVTDTQVKGKGQALEITISTEGDLKGKVLVTGTPTLDDEMVFSLTGFQYEIEAENQWVKMTDLALHRFAEGYLEEQVQVGLKDYFDGLDGKIMDDLAQSNLGSKLALRVSFARLKSYNMVLTKTGIQWILMVEGEASLNLKGGILNSSNS